MKNLLRADPRNASKYSNQHFTLNDSLLLQERQMQNKFARIQFETDEFIAENEELTKEKQLWAGIALALFY